MLELKSYKKPELSAMLGSSGVQALKRKLTRYGIKYEVNGRGENAIFTIKKILNPFKVFCILELGIDAGSDFCKLLYFYYYFFNDEEFRAMPDEVKESRMFDSKHPVSRQTIAGYTRKLDAKNLIDRNTQNFIYYFAYQGEQRMVDRQEYNAAWHEYWNDIKNGSCSFDAIYRMRKNYGGVARKQAIPEINGIYQEEINTFCSMIETEIQKEQEKKLSQPLNSNKFIF